MLRNEFGNQNISNFSAYYISTYFGIFFYLTIFGYLNRVSKKFEKFPDSKKLFTPWGESNNNQNVLENFLFTKGPVLKKYFLRFLDDKFVGISSLYLILPIFSYQALTRSSSRNHFCNV